ncbi:MAG: acyltransferase [Gemmatimonadota bacterium]|jgi:acetyltransferase-like isoleucine patch superfamily enzyme
MKLGGVVRRFLVPRWVTTVWAALRYRCLVSPRAEVELSRNLTLGRGSVISSFTKIKSSGGFLRIGRDVAISTGCFLSTGEGGLEIGDKSMIGSGAAIIASSYDYSDLDVPIADQPSRSRGVRIGHNVWVGTGARILDGADIGSGCIITANSVVTGTIPPNRIASGNPARVIFERR